MIVHTMSQMPLFQTLDPAAVAALAHEVQVQRYRRGAPVPLAPEMVYIVAAGRLRLYRLDGAGRATTMRISPAGESFARLPRDHGQAYNGAICLYALPHAAVLRLYETQPAFARANARLLYQRLADAYERMEDLAVGPMITRLARLLARLAQAHPECQVTLSHQDLAELLGARREQITKALHALQARDLVAPPPRAPGLVVRDPATLLSLTEEGGASGLRAVPAGRRPASRQRGARLPAGPA